MTGGPAAPAAATARTKFVERDGRLRGGRPPDIASGSVLTVDLLASALDDPLRRLRGRMLDVGCGAAPLRFRYDREVDASVRVDWPASAHGDRSVDAFADVASALPFGSDTFDSVLLTDVLEHVPRPAVLLGEISRVLRPGGLLVGSVPFLYGLHEEPHDFGRYTSYAIRAHLVDAGLEPVSIEAYGGSGDVVVDLLAKHLAGLGRAGRPVALGLQRAWTGARRLPVATARRRQLREKFPLGYVFVATRSAG